MTEEVDQPLPPRFRQLKIWSAVGVIAVLLLLGVRWWWGSFADAQRAAYIVAARARGERVLPDDFQPLDIPQSQNAAPLIRAATTQIALTKEQDAWQDGFDAELPLAAADLKMIESIAWSKREVFARLREARSRPYSDWQPKFAKPAFSTLLPYLNWTRQLANVERYTAMYDHATGNDAEAIERVRDILRVHESIGPSTPSIVSHLVGAGVSSVACELAGSLAPTLDVAGMATPPATTRPASRKQVEELIAQLMDESALRESAKTAWHGERMMILDYAPSFTQMFGVRGSMAWLIEPMITLDSLRVARRHDSVGAAIMHPTFPAAVKATADQPSTTQPSRLQKATRAFDANIGIRTTRFERTQYAAILDRRVTATLLAMRLYVLDHGALPRRLDDLVPEYLPQVPADPFTADNRAVAYLPAATQRLLYSVGEDGIDQQGSQSLKPGYAGKSGNRWQTLDVVYDIKLATSTKSSTQPSK